MSELVWDEKYLFLKGENMILERVNEIALLDEEQVNKLIELIKKQKKQKENSQKSNKA